MIWRSRRVEFNTTIALQFLFFCWKNCCLLWCYIVQSMVLHFACSNKWNLSIDSAPNGRWEIYEPITSSNLKLFATVWCAHRQIKATFVHHSAAVCVFTCARTNADIFILMKMAKHIWCQNLFSQLVHTNNHQHIWWNPVETRLKQKKSEESKRVVRTNDFSCVSSVFFSSFNHSMFRYRHIQWHTDKDRAMAVHNWKMHTCKWNRH